MEINTKTQIKYAPIDLDVIGECKRGVDPTNCGEYQESAVLLKLGLLADAHAFQFFGELGAYSIPPYKNNKHERTDLHRDQHPKTNRIYSSRIR